MTKQLQINTTSFGILLLIISFLIFLPLTGRFQENSSELSIGILLDLLITIPVIYYLIIRQTKIPNFTVIYVFILGVILASYIIPIEHQELLSKIKFIVIPTLEIGVIGMVIYKMTSLKTFLKRRKETDFYDKLVIACKEIFPNRIGGVLATEIAVIYYLFSGKKEKSSKEQEFTYFKKSGIKTVLIVFLFLLTAETIVVHILLSKWNIYVAGTISFFGIWAMIQIIAIMRSMDKRLIFINYKSKELILKYGFGCQTTIPFNSIEKIEKFRTQISKDKKHIYLSLFDLIDTNNLTIHLKKENTLNKIYGINKEYKSISLFVDEKEKFVKKMEAILT